MILIADSGSTKTEWRLVDQQNRIQSFTGQGLNPYFYTDEELKAAIEKQTVFLSATKEDDSLQLFFYGAGCGSDSNRDMIKRALTANFNTKRIEIQTDLLGAARAVYNHSAGIAGILGTGMSSCYYDGKKIVQQQPSLGFILGDEGSGAYLGKRFISDYLSNNMPEGLKTRFELRFKLSAAEILVKVYKEAFPNRFLASFSKFIYQNISDPYCIDLVTDSFRKFFEQHICRYTFPGKPHLSCCGSVAFWFSNLLRFIAEEKGIALDKVVESPMAGLCLFHLGEDFIAG